MNAKKRFIKKLFFFVLVVLAVMVPLNFIGSKAGNVYKDGAALVCQTKRQLIASGQVTHAPNKKNVLFMGTSRILAGIIPAYFDELSAGQTFSYNLAFPALTISSSYFALKDYLEHNPAPDYILISPEIRRCRTCTMTNYYAVQGVTRWSEITSLFKNLQAKSIALNFLFPFRMYKYFVAEYLQESLLNPAAIRQVQQKNNAKLAKLAADRGYYYIEEQAGSEDALLAEESLPAKGGTSAKRGIQYNPYDDPYAELFFDLAKRFDIQVMLIQPPFRENQYQQYPQVPMQFAEILKNYDNVHVAPEGWKMKFMNPALFADSSHLKKEGALLYTAAIYQDFLRCFKQ